MNYPWLEEYCLQKTGAEKEYKPDWEASLYKVGGRMFALWGGDRDGRPILSLKCDPVFSEMLRSQYGGIVPGYHLNKVHWISVRLDEDVPDALFRQLVDLSHQLVLNGLSKKLQREIAKGTA
jgi:predicted DNA-binding protein (MmcQ/YjbR family)